jgi:hypothetical protein
MPSKTPKQKRFMSAVANNPKFAKKAGVPQSVGREFAKADKEKEDNEEEKPEEDEETFDSVVRLYLEQNPNKGFQDWLAKKDREAKKDNEGFQKWLGGAPAPRGGSGSSSGTAPQKKKPWTGGPQARGARNPVDVRANDWATPELLNDPNYKALSPANKTKLQNRVKGEILGRPTPGTSKSPSTVKTGRRGTGRFTPRRSQQSRAPKPAPSAPKPAPAPQKTWAGKDQGRPDPTPSVAPKGFGSQAEAKGKVPFKTKYGTVWRKPSNPPGSAPKGFTHSQVPASRGYYNVKPKSTAPDPGPVGAPGAPGAPGDEEGFDTTAKRYLKKKKTKK